MFNHNHHHHHSKRKKIDTNMIKDEIEKLENLKDYIKKNSFQNDEDAEADSTVIFVTIFLKDFIKQLKSKMLNASSFPVEFKFSNQSRFYRLCGADCDLKIFSNKVLKIYTGYVFKQSLNYIFPAETRLQLQTSDDFTSNSHKLSLTTSESESESQKPSSTTSESESDHSSSIKMGRHHR